MYEIYSKYKNSRVIDYNRWSEAPEVDAAVRFLVDAMKAAGLIRKADGYRHNMKTLLMELYHSYLSDKEQYLGFHQGHDHYNFKMTLGDNPNKNRYTKNPHITHAYFTGCIGYLAEQGYVDTKVGGHFTDAKGESYGYLSRMRATEKLVALWQQYNFSPGMISRFKPEEVIVLKAPVRKEPYTYKGRTRTRKVKDPIPGYLDDRRVIAMRKAVQQYNLLLDRTHIDCDVECMLQSDREDLLGRLLEAKDNYRYSINLGSKNVYRVFNNGSLQEQERNFKEGGRFYGAWWIGCPSMLRRYITIDGEPTVELDYSGIHIHLLYAMEKINFADLKMDAYELIPNDPLRALNKLILLTAFNAESAKDTAKAVFNECRLDGKLHLYGLTDKEQIHERLKLLKAKHAPIETYIAEGYGSKLQYQDSRVLEQIIKHFTKLNVPILTVHDSVICQRKYKEFVINEMISYYTAAIKKAYELEVSYHRGLPLAGFYLRRWLKDQVDYVKDRAIQRVKAINWYYAQRYDFKGKPPEIKQSTIKITEEAAQYRCTGACRHAARLLSIRSGKRVFLGKIRVSYEYSEGVASLKITQ